jgi:hypothetical protein
VSEIERLGMEPDKRTGGTVRQTCNKRLGI